MIFNLLVCFSTYLAVRVGKNIVEKVNYVTNDTKPWKKQISEF